MDDLLVGTKVVADFFEVTARAIQQWHKAGMPRVKHGIWDLKECHKWWMANIADIRSTGTDDSMNAIKIEYWKAKGEAERIRVDQLSATLISRDEVARQWARRLIPVFSGLNQLKNRLPPVLEGKTVPQMRVIIDGEIIDLQTALVEPGTFYPKCDIKKGTKCLTKKKRGRPKGSKNGLKSVKRKPAKSLKTLKTAQQSKLKKTSTEKSRLAMPNLKDRITVDSSELAAPTDHGDAPNLTKSPSRKSNRNSKKSTVKSKPSTPRLKN